MNIFLVFFLNFPFRHLIENIEWLQDQLDDFADDYLVFDCPGNNYFKLYYYYFKNYYNNFYFY